MSQAITPVRMPKWGLSMHEGKVVAWNCQEGDEIAEGEELVDIETAKITNVYESPYQGTLRRIVAGAEETLPVGALIAVIAEPGVADDEVDAFVAEFQANFIPEEAEEGGGLGLQTIDAAGATLRYGRLGAGSGDPVVLIHGFGGDLNSWMGILDALSLERETIVIDLPGHGGSTKAIPDPTPDGLAATVAAALDALGVGRAHLVGHSMGAAVALGRALADPGAVRSLTLICPASLPGTALSADYADAFLGARRARDMKRALETLFADPALVSRDFVEDVIRYRRLDGVDEALAQLRAMMESDDFGRFGARITEWAGPLLVIASKEDRIVGAPDASALPAQARLDMADGPSHMPQLEDAESLAATLNDHFRSAEGG